MVTCVLIVFSMLCDHSIPSNSEVLHSFCALWGISAQESLFLHDVQYVYVTFLLHINFVFLFLLFVFRMLACCTALPFDSSCRRQDKVCEQPIICNICQYSCCIVVHCMVYGRILFLAFEQSCLMLSISTMLRVES